MRLGEETLLGREEVDFLDNDIVLDRELAVFLVGTAAVVGPPGVTVWIWNEQKMGCLMASGMVISSLMVSNPRCRMWLSELNNKKPFHVKMREEEQVSCPTTRATKREKTLSVRPKFERRLFASTFVRSMVLLQGYSKGCSCQIPVQLFYNR